MAGKKVMAFNEDDIRRWEHQFEMNAPRPKNGVSATDHPHVLSFREKDTPYGIALAFSLSDGNEPLMFLNPVVARALAAAILNAGKTSRWMPNIMTLSPPWIDPEEVRKV